MARLVEMFLAAAVVGWAGPVATSWAQDARTLQPTHHRVAAVHRREAALPEPLTERRLTIQPRPRGYAPDREADEDVYLDGNVRYNSIRTFDPAPYADSGRQFPFGLDGIGGYGSDLGFGAGHDDALYDRGP